MLIDLYGDNDTIGESIGTLLSFTLKDYPLEASLNQRLRSDIVHVPLQYCSERHRHSYIVVTNQATRYLLTTVHSPY